MIDFYDLMKEYNEIHLESYEIKILNELNGISIENTYPVNESGFSSILDSIKSFFKKLWGFIKKWWNKFWKFLGIDEDTPTETTIDSDDGEKDSDKVIEKEKNSSVKEEMKKSKYIDNYKEIKEAMNNICNGNIIKVNDENIVRTNELYRFTKRNISNIDYERTLKYAMLLKEASNVVLVDINKLHELAIDIYSVNNPLYGNFFEIVEKLIKIEKEIINKNDIDNEAMLSYIDSSLQSLNDFNEINNLDVNINNDDYLYEISSKNNRMVFLYSLMLSRITFVKYISENEKNSKLLIGRIEFLSLKVNEYVKNNKEYFGSYDDKIKEFNTKIQKMLLTFSNIVKFMNLSIGFIEKSIKNANNKIITEFIEKSKESNGENK